MLKYTIFILPLREIFDKKLIDFHVRNYFSTKNNVKKNWLRAERLLLFILEGDMRS